MREFDSRELKSLKIRAIDYGQLILSDHVRSILKAKNIKLEISVFNAGNDDEKGKPRLVMLHGMCACKEAFNDLNEHFKQKYNVYTLDLPGHGESFNVSKMENLLEDEKSSLAKELYSLPNVVRILSLCFQQLRIENADVYGWSIGGHIAHGMAALHPELFHTLTTTGTPPINYANEEEFRIGFTSLFVDMYLKSWKESPDFYGEDMAKGIAESMGFLDLEGIDQYFVEAIEKSDPLFRQYLYTTLNDHKESAALYGRDFLENNTHQIPLCFIEGEKDAGINFENTEAFFNERLKAKEVLTELHSFPEAGHASFRVYPKTFTNKFSGFLKNARGSSKETELRNSSSPLAQTGSVQKETLSSTTTLLSKGAS